MSADDSLSLTRHNLREAMERLRRELPSNCAFGFFVCNERPSAKQMRLADMEPASHILRQITVTTRPQPMLLLSTDKGRNISLKVAAVEGWMSTVIYFPSDASQPLKIYRYATDLSLKDVVIINRKFLARTN